MRTLRMLAAGLVSLGVVAFVPTASHAATYFPVSGAGSTWSQNAIDQWRRDVNANGIQVNYAGTGSSDGRNQFRNGTVDFAISEIPYGISQGGNPDPLPSRGFAYMPIVAGGTSFMYNLTIGANRVTNLRLSGPTLAKMFTGNITYWDDPAIKADNPGLTMPHRKVVPVVRSDGSGTTAQFTTWMASQNRSLWDAYCTKAGIPSSAGCGTLSQYPVVAGSGFTAQSGSLGVSGYVSQVSNIGTINYVEYSYALNSGFPVIKVLNKAGYYVEPTAPSVAVALQKASVRTNVPATDPNYLTSDLSGVYVNSDPRSYPLSSYSYGIVPTDTSSNFSTDKGRSLSAFANYFLCEGQRKAPLLGYSPLPLNLVVAGLNQVRRIPGAETANTDVKAVLSKCNNPTFSSTGENLLAKTAPQPQACDKSGGITQCPNGTGGASQTPTRVKDSGTTGGDTTGGGNTGGGNTGGGNTGGGNTGGGNTGGGNTGGGNTGGGNTGGGNTGGGNTGGGNTGGGNTGGGNTGGGNTGGGTVVDPATGTVVDPATGTVVDPGAGTDGSQGGAVVMAGQAFANPAIIPSDRASNTGIALLAVAVLIAIAIAPPIIFGIMKRRTS